MTAANGSLPGMSTEELRSAVRAVLREVLPAGVAAPAHAHPIEIVSVRNDSELDAFVRRVAALCDDPAMRAELRAGRGGFRMSASVAAVDHQPERQAPTPVLRVDHGAVTERRVKQAASEGARLIVGRKAVLTPLARERAQALGVVVERER